jgi:hypothetical protein
LLDNPQGIFLPQWTSIQVSRFVEEHYRSLEAFLDLGAFHHLLPVPMRRQALINQFDVTRFVSALSALKLLPASEELAAKLSTIGNYSA